MEKYYEFIKNPNILSFNNFISNIIELSKFNKVTKSRLKEIKDELITKHLDNGNLIIKNTNIYPILDASCFPINFVIPTDNKLWIVQNINSINQWLILDDFNFNQYYENGFLKSFIFNKTITKYFKFYKLKKQLNLTGGELAIGETKIFYDKIKPGKYDIYDFGGSLLISPEKTNKQDLIYNRKWNFINKIEVSGNNFGFHNGDIMKFINDQQKKKKKDNHYLEDVNYNYLTFIDNSIFKFIYGSDILELNFNKLNKFIKDNKLNKEVIGIFCNNKDGYGSYNVYKSNNCFLILSHSVENILNQMKILYNL